MLFQTCMAYFFFPFNTKGECTSHFLQYNSPLWVSDRLWMTWGWPIVYFWLELFILFITCSVPYCVYTDIHWIWIELNWVCVSKGGWTEGRERPERRACYHWTRKCNLLYDTYVWPFKSLGSKWFGILTTLYWHKPKEVWSCIYCIFRSLLHPSNFVFMHMFGQLKNTS